MWQIFLWCEKWKSKISSYFRVWCFLKDFLDSRWYVVNSRSEVTEVRLNGTLTHPHSRFLDISECRMATQVSKKRKFVADGVFKAELNEFLTRELAEDGYSGVEVSDHIKLKPLPGSDTCTWLRIFRSAWLPPGPRSSSWPPGPRTFWERRAGGSGSWPASSRRGSTSPRELSSSTPRRWSFIVCVYILITENVNITGGHSRTLRHCPGRVPPLQADRRSGREEGLLRCSPVGWFLSIFLTYHLD